MQGHERFFHDYFADYQCIIPMYFEGSFEWVILFFYVSIQELKLMNHTLFKKRNATKMLGFSSLQKMTITIKMHAYGVTTDLIDEYLRIEKSIAIKSLIC